MYIARQKLKAGRSGQIVSIEPGSVIEDFARWPCSQQKPLLDYGYVEKVGEAVHQLSAVDGAVVPHDVSPTLSFSCPRCHQKSFGTERGLRLHSLKVHGE